MNYQDQENREHLIHEEYRGHWIMVDYEDEHGESPREWGTLGTIHVLPHNRYLHNEAGERDGIFTPEDFRRHFPDEGTKSKALVFPLYLYVHSVTSVSIQPFVGRAQHAEWDSGLAGFVYAKHADIRKWYGVKKITPEILDRAEKLIQAEIEILDKYLLGEVYWMNITKDGELVESCGDIYDDPQTILEEAKKTVDAIIDKGQQHAD